MKASRDQVLNYRVHAQQLDRNPDTEHEDTDVLDLGVQETGNQGSDWALARRGVRFDPQRHIIAWTLRGAPTAYRREQIAEIAAATAPYDETDAAKRIFDAAKPLKAAGIPVLEALAVVSGQMERIVVEPTVKGQMSARLTEVLSDPYLRYCRPCGAIHSYEQTFRLSALPAGLELEPGTSPPVLRPIPGWTGPADGFSPALDPIRACLHLFGPLTPKLVAGYLDAPVKAVQQHWPADTQEVDVDGRPGEILATDAAALADAAPADDRTGTGVRLLGSHDLFLQARDRELLVPDDARRKQLWPVLGRPGAILHGHDIVGTWRPRSAGKKLSLAVEAWTRIPGNALEEEADRLATHRGQVFAGFE